MVKCASHPSISMRRPRWCQDAALRLRWRLLKRREFLAALAASGLFTSKGHAASPFPVKFRQQPAYDSVLAFVEPGLDEFPGETFQGTIVRDSDSIDLASRTLNVEVDVDNAKNRIKVGAYAFVHLMSPRSSHSPTQSFTIPANTLLFRSEGLRVGVVRNGHAELVPITIGRDFGATVEVVAGLQPTDQVIVNPSDSLTSGRQVQVNAPQAGGSK